MTMCFNILHGFRWLSMKALPFVILSLVITVYITYRPSYFSSDQRKWNRTNSMENADEKLNPHFIPQKRERKLVLLWTPYFEETNWLPSTDQLQCSVRECDVTTNRTLLNDSSAVVLHWRNFNQKVAGSLACSNASCPVLVLFNMEAPPNTHRNTLMPLNDKIHLTVTYRRDSDIFNPYGRIVKRQDAWKMPDFEQDRELVCWLVSNCHTSSYREIYVKLLQEHIHVSIYGKCGRNRCPYEDALECYIWLSKKCKFYLSFENSICTDYSTEKLYNVLLTDMIPIVLGGDNYSMSLPPNSYIDALDFPSPKALAQHLKSLNIDQKRYKKYFEWKKTHKAVHKSYHWYCKLCEILHNGTMPKLQPHRDIVSWWYKDDCTSYETMLNRTS